MKLTLKQLQHFINEEIQKMNETFTKEDTEEISDSTTFTETFGANEQDGFCYDDDDELLHEKFNFNKFVDDICKREKDNKDKVKQNLNNRKNLFKEYTDTYAEKAVNRLVIKGK